MVGSCLELPPRRSYLYGGWLWYIQIETGWMSLIETPSKYFDLQNTIFDIPKSMNWSSTTDSLTAIISDTISRRYSNGWPQDRERKLFETIKSGISDMARTVPPWTRVLCVFLVPTLEPVWRGTKQFRREVQLEIGRDYPARCKGMTWWPVLIPK